MCKKIGSASFKNIIFEICSEIINLIYMYKKYLALNNLQRLIYHKTTLNQIKKYKYKGTENMFL